MTQLDYPFRINIRPILGPFFVHGVEINRVLGFKHPYNEFQLPTFYMRRGFIDPSMEVWRFGFEGHREIQRFVHHHRIAYPLAPPHPDRVAHTADFATASRRVDAHIGRPPSPNPSLC